MEVDEAYVGGRKKNKHANKRFGKAASCASKTVVSGGRDRESNRISASVLPGKAHATLRAYVEERTGPDTIIVSDEEGAYKRLPNHCSVPHLKGVYVDGIIHTNGLDSFWALLKRGYHGIYHQWSRHHAQRYVNEFAGQHNLSHWTPSYG